MAHPDLLIRGRRVLLPTGVAPATLHVSNGRIIAVTAFGLTTSFNYALSGLVNWPLAAVFIAGGVVGSALGTRASRALSADKGKLNTVFASFVMLVAFYMIWKSWGVIAAA